MKKILVPVVTPFKENQEIDYDALKKLVKKILSEGADGIYAGGSSAECFSLTQEEKKNTLETVVNAAEGAYVIAHIGAPSSYLAQDLARHAKQLGVNELASVPPIYFKYSINEIKSYYEDIYAASELPIMMYSISNAGYNFDLKDYYTLLRDSYIKSLKFTIKDYYILERLKANTDKIIFNGVDECLLGALVQGADGAIGTTYNFMLSTARNIAENCEKDLLFAEKEQDKICRVVEEIFCPFGGIAATKYILSLQGINAGRCRAPFKTLNPEEKKSIEKIIKTIL